MCIRDRGRSYSDQQHGSTYADNESSNRGRSEKNATSNGESSGWSETLVDKLEDFQEVSSRTYYTFDEQMRQWAKRVRQLKTGQAIAKIKDDDQIHSLDVDQLVIPETSALAELKAKLLEENFANRELFLPKHEVDAQWDSFVELLGNGLAVPPNQQVIIDAVQSEQRGGEDSDSAFR